MADASINVVITANAAGFVSGVQQATASLGQFQSAATQTQAAAAGAAPPVQALHNTLNQHPTGLNAAIHELNGGLKDLLEPIAIFSSRLRETAELAGALILAEKLTEFVEKMAQMGEQALKMSAVLGSSVEDYSRFANTLEIVGVNAEQTGRTLERLQRNTSEALADPTSRAARGFTALGVTMEELAAHENNAIEMLELLRQKFQETEGGANRTAAFIAIMGRGFDLLIPYLRKTDEEFAAFKKAVADTGSTIDESMARQMEETGEKVNIFGLALKGISISIFAELKPGIDAIVTSLTSLAEAFNDSAKAGGAFDAVLQGIAEVVKVVVAGVETLVIGVRQFVDVIAVSLGPLVNLLKVIATVAEDASTGHFSRIADDIQQGLARGQDAFENALGDMKKAGETFERDMKRIFGGVGDAAGDMLGPWSETPAPDKRKVDPTGGRIGGSGDSRVTEWRQQLQQQLEAEGNFFKDATAEEKAFWEDKKATNKEGWDALAGMRRAYIEEYQKTHPGTAAADVPFGELPGQPVGSGANEKRAQTEERDVDTRIYEATKALAREQLANQLRAIEAEKNARLGQLETELTAAKGNALAIAQIEQQRTQVVLDSIAQEKAAREESGATKFQTPDEAAADRDKQVLEVERAQNQELKTQQKLREELIKAQEHEADVFASLDKARERIQTAQLSQQVDTHQIANIDALREEAALADQLAQQEIARYQAIADSANASADDRIAAYEKILKVAEESAAREEELAKKVADAQKKAAEEGAKAFVTAFSSAGSALDSFVEASVLHTKTRAAAIRDLYQSLEKDALKLFTGLASQFAAQQLAKATGQTLEPGKGLSDLLGQSVAKLLGIGTKEDAEATRLNIQRLANQKLDEVKMAVEKVEAAIREKGVGVVPAAPGAPGAPGAGGGQAPSQTAAEYAAGRGPFPGSSQMESEMFQWLEAHGYSPTAAAAVIGNAAAESSLRPDAIGKAKELGLFQENPAVGNRQALEAYAASTGRAPTDWQAQMEFMDQQLTKLDPTFKSSGAAAGELAKRFETNLERPKSLADAPRRAGYAEQVLESQGHALADAAQQHKEAAADLKGAADRLKGAGEGPAATPYTPAPAGMGTGLRAATTSDLNLPQAQEGAHVDDEGLLIVHGGETVVPDAQLNQLRTEALKAPAMITAPPAPPAAPETTPTPESAKIGPGPDTPLVAALRGVMHIAGVSDIVEALRSAKQVVPALERGETASGIGAGLSTASTLAMAFSGLISPEAKVAEGAEEAARISKVPGRGGLVNPLPIPADYQAELNRFLNRAAGVAQPKNPAVEIAPGMYVGDVNFDQWKSRLETVLTPEDIEKSRVWYKEALPAFETYFGKDLAPQMMGAWLTGNVNATPSFAQLSATRTLEQVRNRTPEISQQTRGGLAHDALTSYWQSVLSDHPEAEGTTGAGSGRKIYDFIDSALGKTTRTFYGDDPRAGAPAVADVHSLRDMGYVDDVIKKWVATNYGEGLAENLQRDMGGGGPSATQYEAAAIKMRSFTEELNARGYAGGSWTPEEMQAVGWTAMSKMLGRKAETAQAAIEANIRNLSYELDFGAGAPFKTTFPEWDSLSAETKSAVSSEVLPKIVDFAASVSGAQEFSRLEGVGGWGQWTNPAFKSRFIASPEVAGDTADIIGYLAEQTKVFGYRWSNSGKKLGIAAYGDDLGNPETVQKLWEHVTTAVPDLAAGFSPSIHEGRPGIEIILDKGGARVQAQVERDFTPAINNAARELGIDVDVQGFRAQEESREHDWTQDPTGGSYLARLGARYGSALPDRLELFKRQELEPAIRQSIDRNLAAPVEQTVGVEGRAAGEVAPGAIAPEVTPPPATAPPEIERTEAGHVGIDPFGVRDVERRRFVARQGDQEIGSLSLDLPEGADVAYGQTVKVEPTFRRQGVANALYDRAKADIGERTLVPSPDLSPDAIAFWRSRLAAMPPEEAAKTMEAAEGYRSSLRLPADMRSLDELRGAPTPQYEEGGTVAETGLAMVHEGETIIPADAQSSFFQQFGDVAAQKAEENKGKSLGERALDPTALAQAEGVALSTGPGAIRAFHGSPHDFSAFDSSKIGAGEGAQTYGSGLYFAEKESVARGYRDAVTAQLRATSAAPDNAHIEAAKSFFDSGYSGADTLTGLQQAYKSASVDQLESAMREARTGGSGRMYEVGINADPESFLHWDKPLSEQSEKVQTAVRQSAGKLFGEVPSALETNIASGISGANAYKNWIGKDDIAAAEALREAGIPGIRYLDQGSRAGGEGTHNYVVFDDKTIEIIRKYGIPGLISGGGAAAAAGASTDTSGIPQLDTGGMITRTGLAMVHKGETVVPASEAAVVVPSSLGGSYLTGNQASVLAAEKANTLALGKGWWTWLLVALPLLMKLLGLIGGDQKKTAAAVNKAKPTPATGTETQTTTPVNVDTIAASSSQDQVDQAELPAELPALTSPSETAAEHAIQPAEPAPAPDSEVAGPPVPDSEVAGPPAPPGLLERLNNAAWFPFGPIPPSGVTDQGISVTGETPMPLGQPVPDNIGWWPFGPIPPSGVTDQGVSVTGETPLPFPSNEAGAVVPSAGGGLQVGDTGMRVQPSETSLPGHITRGVRAMAARGDVGAFSAARMTSSAGGLDVPDGKGGQLAIVHPGELILPAHETGLVLGAMASSEDGTVVPSAAAGYSPTIVATSGGITTESRGFMTPVLQPTNPAPDLRGLGWLGLIGLVPLLAKLLGSGGGSDGLFSWLGKLFGGAKAPSTIPSTETLLAAPPTGVAQVTTPLKQADLPQLDEGGDITQTGVAVVHAGETVSPTDSGSGIAGGLGAVQNLLSGFSKLTGALGTTERGLTALGSGASTASSALGLLKSGLSLASSLFGGGGGGSGGGGGGGGGGLLGTVSSLFGVVGGITKVASFFGFEKGGVVPESGLAMVHQDEMILPRPISQGFQSLFANAATHGPDGSGPPPGMETGPQSLGQLLGLVHSSSVGTSDRAIAAAPRFALGAWEIDRDMVGMLEQGEAVLPRSFADGLRSTAAAGSSGNGGGNGGDTHNHYYSGDTHNITAFDGHDVQRVLMSHGPTIAKALARQNRNFNPHARR